VNLAGFYRHIGRLDEMEQALRTMESRPLDWPAALMDGASLLLRTGRDYPLAIRLVRRYLASGPVEEWPAFKAHFLLGELLEKQGERDAAAEQYRAALAMAHTFAPAQEGLQRVAR
jgi:tetratricopeptide (TPR) repeat protein